MRCCAYCSHKITCEYLHDWRYISCTLPMAPSSLSPLRMVPGSGMEVLRYMRRKQYQMPEAMQQRTTIETPVAMPATCPIFSPFPITSCGSMVAVEKEGSKEDEVVVSPERDVWCVSTGIEVFGVVAFGAVSEGIPKEGVDGAREG